MKKKSLLILTSLSAALLLSGCIGAPYASGTVGTRIGNGGYISGTVGVPVGGWGWGYPGDYYDSGYYYPYGGYVGSYPRYRSSYPSYSGYRHHQPPRRNHSRSSNSRGSSPMGRVIREADRRRGHDDD